MLGFAVASRPTNILLAIAGAAYVFFQRRRAFSLFAALTLVPAALVTLYSAVYLGNPLALGQAYRPGGFMPERFPRPDVARVVPELGDTP